MDQDLQSRALDAPYSIRTHESRPHVGNGTRRIPAEMEHPEPMKCRVLVKDGKPVTPEGALLMKRTVVPVEREPER